MAKILVEAMLPGFYGKYREPGDVFEVEDQHSVSSRWMKPVSGKEAERKLDEQNDDKASKKKG